ncbi:TniQ family protein [Pseudomonas chlororaphis]|uniref:TniQ family protein n=1 Tax=Pseudomonas chlororaphis TaxID=587753 RepID=UPI00209AB96E|nr:TniQ family protein [Pseudomonas chlororaphis]MCO7572017.1 TniQ family protein [Pseudomonas chlororaphis]MCO7589797.1 TniQ family protein [Pseudomonas chlororaphis]
MKPKKKSFPEPLPDETLSSWMWRVNSTSTIPFISHERFSSPEVEIKARDTRGIWGERFADRDLLSENTFIEPLMRTFNISPAWLDRRFPEFSQLTIPTQFRRAFCSECFIESFEHVGIPISKVQWCYLTKPMCELHGVPLQDSTRLFIDYDDYSVQAFVSYWDEPKFKEAQNHVRETGRLTHGLALKAQKQLQKLIRRASKSGEGLKVQMFVLTLMRAMMMPAYHHAYPKIAFNNWGGTHAYTGLGVHGDFYQEIYRSTCLARLYALYFSAIALGWISSGQAFKALHEGYYAPWNIDQIWSRLDNYPGVLRLLASELKSYQSQYLSIADLNSPKLNSLSYDA